MADASLEVGQTRVRVGLAVKSRYRIPCCLLPPLRYKITRRSIPMSQQYEVMGMKDLLRDEEECYNWENTHEPLQGKYNSEC